jgi:hypothetical protein
LHFANASDRSFSSFQTAVSLTPVGDGIVRSVLSTLFGLNANTLVRVDQSPGSCN